MNHKRLNYSVEEINELLDKVGNLKDTTDEIGGVTEEVNNLKTLIDEVNMITDKYPIYMTIRFSFI